jgi:hypothetical protein
MVYHPLCLTLKSKLQAILRHGTLLPALLFGLSACTTAPKVIVQQKVLSTPLVTISDPEHFRQWYQHLQSETPSAQLALCQIALTSAPSSAFHQLACGLTLLPHASNITERSQALRWYQTGLEFLVRSQLQQGKWQPRHRDFQLQLQLPTDESGLPFTRYTQVADLVFREPWIAPAAQNPQGVGLVMAAERAFSKQATDQNYPREGIFRAVTVLATHLHFDDQNQLQIQLTGYYLTDPKSVSFGKQSYPLQYDSATAYLLLLREARIDQAEWAALFDGNNSSYDYGIYSIAPLSGSKIPILMIHGLHSSPMIWLRLSHAIYADPELSAKYQIWHAFYPTGAPPFFNAMRLRAQVDELRARLQLQLAMPADLPMVLIGHSMGGIIAKTFIVEPEYRLWDQTFMRRPEKLPRDHRDFMRYQDVFIFKPRPYVQSVFFLDTPHHGAEMAESWYSRLASAWIRLPSIFSDLNRRVFKNLSYDLVTPQMKRYLKNDGPTSVDVLSPQHPVLREIAKLPYQKPVYSIIGSTSTPFCYNEKSCAQLNDSVVPFFSAHQSQAQEQIIVLSEHNSYQSPDAIAFILQKLRAQQ